MTKQLVGALALGSVLALTSFSSSRARACGGLFCSAQSPTPVDQNAERILFRVHDDGSVTAVVEISYSGDPSDFSWIIPVPETPTVDVVPAGALRALDQATAPQFLPPPTTCTRSGAGFPFGLGLACDEALAPSGLRDFAVDGRPPVGVTDLPRVGPYDDIVVVESTDERALIDWLNAHDYVVTPAMAPLIQAYVDEGSKFLALRLAADAGVSDIQPISFTCPPGVDGVRIPLRLTGVSAEPEMGVMVLVAGPSRFQPANYRALALKTDLVQLSQNSGQLNYFPLISWLVDEEGGKAFVTEYAADAEDARTNVNNAFAGAPEDFDYLAEVFNEHRYLTRMYTRISGWEMDEDPVFLPTTGPDVARTRDLSGRPSEEVCTGSVQRVPCGDTYCGPGALCATTDAGVDGCVCPEGTVARQVNAPSGPAVFCQETGFEMLSSIDGLGDPCSQATCGRNGRCQAVNGFSACMCDEGFAAIIDTSVNVPFAVRCEGAVKSYSPEQLLWVEREGDGARVGVSSQGGCASTHGQRATGFFAFVALWFGGALALRRALRRR